MRKEIKTDRFRDGIQIKARMIKDATGIVFANKTKGAKSSEIRLKRAASTARKVPAKMPQKKPQAILDREKRMDCQNGSVRAREKSRVRTATGETQRIGSLSARLAASQTASHSRIDHSFSFGVGKLLLEIEVIVWKCSSYGFWILFQ